MPSMARPLRASSATHRLLSAASRRMLCEIFFELVMDSPDWPGLDGPDGAVSDASSACTTPVLGLRPVFGSPVLGFGAGQTQARAAKGFPFS